MNEKHLQLCSSEEWAEHIRTDVLPWVFQAVQTPADLLEIGPGPGATTDVLRHQVPHITAIESDPVLAGRLAERFVDDPGVEVRQGDATALEFADGQFSAAASFTMLHHVPSADLQDLLFAEVARVLCPGGVFFGSDSLDGPGFRRLHEGDICVPIDPLTLADRLHRAGFVDVDLAVLSIGVRFTARTPSH